MVFACRPILEQIAVVRTRRVARFSGDVGCHRPVPIANIQNLRVRRAARLLEGGSTGGIDREPVSGTRDWTAMELVGVQGMREVDLVQPTPLPALHVGSLFLPELSQRGGQRVLQSFRMRVGL